MRYLAEINIMPHKALLDPQGKAVAGGLQSVGFTSLDNVRVGKHISFDLEASSAEEAEKVAEEACTKLLANKVMEYFEISISELA